MLNLKDFIPPIALKIRNRLASRTVEYQSFDEALAVCGRGYEEGELVAVVLQKTKILRDNVSSFPTSVSTIQTLLAVVSTIQRDQLRVIDFGGACGAHYFIARSFLPATVKLHWRVVETPAMVAVAKELENDELKFFDRLDLAKADLHDIDLLHSSGAIQYVPKPRRILSNLIDCASQFVLLNRLAISPNDRDIITVQRSNLSHNGPGPLPTGMQDGTVCYPVTFISRQSLISLIERKYRIKLISSDSSEGHGLALFAERNTNS